MIIYLFHISVDVLSLNVFNREMHLLNFQIKYFFGENIPTFSVIFNNLLIIFFEIFQIYRNHGKVLETTRFNKKQRAFKEKSSRNNHPRRILQVVIFHVVGGQYSFRGQFCSGKSSVGQSSVSQSSGGNILGGNFPGGNVSGEIRRGAIFWRQFYWEQFSGHLKVQ